MWRLKDDVKIGVGRRYMIVMSVETTWLRFKLKLLCWEF
jgi:hypothetical protein